MTSVFVYVHYIQDVVSNLIYLLFVHGIKCEWVCCAQDVGTQLKGQDHRDRSV